MGYGLESYERVATSNQRNFNGTNEFVMYDYNMEITAQEKVWLMAILHEYGYKGNNSTDVFEQISHNTTSSYIQKEPIDKLEELSFEELFAQTMDTADEIANDIQAYLHEEPANEPSTIEEQSKISGIMSSKE